MREQRFKFARVTLALIASCAVAPACVYDFDGLREPDADVGVEDVGGDDVGEPDAGEPDAGEDADVGEPPVEFVYGAACADDSGCGEGGVCAEGFCTTTCEDTAGCEVGSACANLGGVSVCVPRCDLGFTCETPGGADLVCTQYVRDLSPYSPSVVTSSACRADGDGDGVADAEDNCPNSANAEQHDMDGDGEGDACDAAPWCHPSASDGVVEFPSVDWDLTGMAFPQIIDNGWAPVLGGLGAGDVPSASALVLERDAVAWQTPGNMLYPGVDFVSTPLKDGTYLVAPGRLPEDPRQTGRMLKMTREGEFTQLGTVSRVELYDPIMAATGRGDVLVLSYTTSTAAGGLNFRLSRMTPEGDAFSTLFSGQLPSRGEWRVSPSGRGGLIFYTESLADLDGNAPFTRVYEVDQFGGTVLGPLSYGLPMTDEGQPIDPLIVGTASGLRVVFDRANGQAYTLTPLGTFTRAEAYDQAVEVNGPRYMVRPSGLGVVVVGKDPEDARKLKAYEWDLACALGADAPDTDMDSVPDLVDVCHLEANAGQDDLDGDGLGDACDTDRDGDGTPNDVDGPLDPDAGTPTSLRASDHDGDGIDDDADDDDDQDGLPDVSDRFPLDTDNDGLNNALDGDDDGDGYSDRGEGVADPLDPLSVPDGGRVLYVSGGQVVLSELSATETQETLTVPTTGPRFSSDGRLVSALAGARDAATGIAWVSLQTGITGQLELGLTLRGAEVTGSSVNTTEGLESARVTRLVALHGRADAAGRYDATQATFTLDVDGMQMRMDQISLDRYPLVDRMDVAGNTLFFTGAPAGCEECLTAYLLPLGLPGITPQGVTQGALGVRWVSTNGSGVVTVSDGEDADELRQDGALVALPAGVVRVESAAGMSRDQSIVISGAREDGSYSLWWLNGRNGKWYKLPGVLAEPSQVDWAK